MTEKRESIKVLEECIEVQNKKAQDYQNVASSVKQADYYRLGIDSIFDMMNTKMLRIKSLIETAKANPGSTPNHESIEDSIKDLINYSSFGVSYLRGKIEGQNPKFDMFNRPTYESDFAERMGTMSLLDTLSGEAFYSEANTDGASLRRNLTITTDEK